MKYIRSLDRHQDTPPYFSYHYHGFKISKKRYYPQIGMVLPAFCLSQQIKFTHTHKKTINKHILDLAKFNQIITEAQDPPLNQKQISKKTWVMQHKSNDQTQNKLRTLNPKKYCFEHVQHVSSFPALQLKLEGNVNKGELQVQMPFTPQPKSVITHVL